MRPAIVIALLALAGCGDDGGAPDTGTPDAGTDAAGDAGPDARPPLDAMPDCPPPLGMASRRDPVPGVAHPLDDTLRLNQIQAKGTHNSYHVAQDGGFADWDYTHAPLDQQLGEQGVRKVELDTYLDRTCNRYEVYHAPVVDEGTRCRLFTDCLQTLRDWSDAHPGHHPLFVQIEPKDIYREASAEDELVQMEAEILSVFPPELLITPDMVRGTRATLAEAIAMDGWPTLGEVRGRVLFFMNRSDALRDVYTHGGASLDGRIIFAEADEGSPYAAVLIINDPVSGASRLRAAVEAGFIVRTRADADRSEALAGDTTRRTAALESGAQLISTDFPVPLPGFDYVVAIPGGTPSRCNPVAAPPECVSEAVEDPALLSP